MTTSRGFAHIWLVMFAWVGGIADLDHSVLFSGTMCVSPIFLFSNCFEIQHLVTISAHLK